MNLRGSPLFICLDGMDGTGKTTQCEMLVEWLRGQGREVVFARDPGSTELGTHIRGLLLGHKGAMSRECEMSLFFAARAQMIEEIIKPAFSSGKDVVLDRYLLATIAYQGYGNGMDVARMWQAGLFAAGDVMPELLLVLDLPVEVALARLKGMPDRLESRGADYFGRVRQGFLEEAKAKRHRINSVSALGNQFEVHHRVLNEVKAAFSI